MPKRECSYRWILCARTADVRAREGLGHRGGAMQDLGYELPRILIPRTSVNKGKRGGLKPRCSSPPKGRVLLSAGNQRRSDLRPRTRAAVSRAHKQRSCRVHVYLAL